MWFMQKFTFLYSLQVLQRDQFPDCVIFTGIQKQQREPSTKIHHSNLNLGAASQPIAAVPPYTRVRQWHRELAATSCYKKELIS